MTTAPNGLICIRHAGIDTRAVQRLAEEVANGGASTLFDPSRRAGFQPANEGRREAGATTSAWP